MNVTKRQLRRIIRETKWGGFTGGAAPLDEPMRDSGLIPKDQLRRLADIFINDMGMSPEAVLSKPEFAEQGITDLRQLEEGKMKVTKRQLKRIIKEEKQDLLRESSYDALRNTFRSVNDLSLVAHDANKGNASLNEVSESLEEAVNEVLQAMKWELYSKLYDVDEDWMKAAFDAAFREFLSGMGGD